jgi:hypothetical protein
MILLNNAVGLAILFRKDKETAEKPYLQMGWFGSSFLVVLAIYFGPNAHTWHWGTVESVSFGACGIALLFRLVKNVAAAMTAYICAVFISTIPIALDYWHQPQPSSIWLWVSTLVACPLAIYGATQRTRSYVTMLVFMIGVNGVMLFLSLPIR